MLNSQNVHDFVAYLRFATNNSRLAQTVERKTLNLVVVGSIPTVGVHLTIIAPLAQLDSASDF